VLIKRYTGGSSVEEHTMDPTSTETTIADDDFIEEWLERGDSWSIYTRFRHVPLTEHADKRGYILEPLARTIFIHHNDPEEYRAIVAELGYEQAAREFDKRPRDDKTRKGNFGEILASEYLRQVEGYDLPVYRLRWNTNPDTSMRGEDVLAFKFGHPDGTGREICVTEAKVMSQYDRDEVETAHKQLRSGYRPRPNSIPFVYSVLRLRGEREKAAIILAFQNRLAPHPPIRRNLLMLVTGSRPRNPFRVIEVESEVVENLTAANLSLTDLTNLVNELFEAEVNLDDL
jgi:hypothetical protein